MSSLAPSETVNKTQLTLEEEKENERKIIQAWTTAFFSMGRIEPQGEQILVFPGLFSELFVFFIISICCYYFDKASFDLKLMEKLFESL